jgi:hypothetical protein
MIVQYRLLAFIRHLTFGIIIASKYKVLTVLGQCREILGEKWSAGCDVHSADCVSVLVGIFTAATSSAAKCGTFTSLKYYYSTRCPRHDCFLFVSYSYPEDKAICCSWTSACSPDYMAIYPRRESTAVGTPRLTMWGALQLLNELLVGPFRSRLFWLIRLIGQSFVAQRNLVH